MQQVKPGDSWQCECGKTHKLSDRIHANWSQENFHACECKRKHSIKAGAIKLVGR